MPDPSDEQISPAADAPNSAASDAPPPSDASGKTQPTPPISAQDSLVGELVIKTGLATRQDIEDCKAFQQHMAEDGSTPPTLAQMLVDNQLITQRQLDRLEPDLADAQPQHQIPGFQILEVAGQGANAKVYKARQLSLDRIVALKVLPREAAQNEEFLARFYAEGRAAGKLNHPNVVGALDVGQAGEFHYFAMEYIEGENVFELLMERDMIPEMEAIKIALDVAKGLEHAHAAGLVHRDVKPQNIIITSAGVTKLTDLGLARVQDDAEAAEQEKGKAFGTPYYISPEQIRGAQDVDFRADLYSLGATLYYMLTGKVPFDAATPRDVMLKHLKEKLVPAHKLNRFVSPALSNVIKVCMAKRRQDRYLTTKQLVQDLAALADDEPPLHAQSILGEDLAVTEESQEERKRESAGEILRSTLAEKAEAKKAHKRAELMMYLAMSGWLLAAVFLGMWLLALLAKDS